MSYQKSTTKQHPTTQRSERVKMLERDLRAFLKPSRHAVFSFIFDRTVRFNKEWERIPIRHMLEGINSKSGEVIHGGLSIKESTVRRCLKELLELGIIIREKVPYGLGSFTFKFKIEWDCVRDFITEEQILARNQKCGQSVGIQNASTPLSNRRAPPVKMEVHNNRKVTTERNNRSKELRTSCADLRGDEEDNSPEVTQEPTSDTNSLAAITKVADVGAEIPRGDLRKKSVIPADKSSKAATLFDVWRSEMAYSWPDIRVLPLTPKERGCAGNLVKYLGNDTIPFMQWSIANWHMVRRSKFHLSHKVQFPKYPDFMFMFSFRKSFVEVWNDREFYERMAKNPKAGLIVYLRKQGYTEEQATEVAAEREVEKTKLTEIERREARVIQRENQLVYAARYVNRGATPEEQERAAANAARARGRSRQIPTEFKPMRTEFSEW